MSIQYKEEEYKIVWDNSETGEIWDKGTKFTVSVLFKLRLHEIKIIKLIKTVRQETSQKQ